VNLSDLAAKGGHARGLRADVGASSLGRSLGSNRSRRRLARMQALFGCPLLGAIPYPRPVRLMISITAFGRVRPGKMVHRSAPSQAIALS